jgi:hypothetical protein
MDFQHLLDGAEVLSLEGNAAIKGLAYDSRQVKEGFAFIAMRGEATDGNRYIDQAIASGAVAVVTDSATEPARKGVIWAVVSHGRRALARLSANFYKHPAERLRVTGVTGTNGKTTTAFIVEAILRERRTQERTGGHGGVSPAGQRIAGAAHHAGVARLESPLRAGGGLGRNRSRDGSQFARPRPTARIRRAVRRGNLHQPHARPSRLSRRYGTLLCRETNPV